MNLGSFNCGTPNMHDLGQASEFADLLVAIKVGILLCLHMSMHLLIGP